MASENAASRERPAARATPAGHLELQGGMVGERAKAKSSRDQQLVLWLSSFSPALFALVDLRLGELQILGTALVLQNINEEAL